MGVDLEQPEQQKQPWLGRTGWVLVGIVAAIVVVLVLAVSASNGMYGTDDETPCEKEADELIANGHADQADRGKVITACEQYIDSND